MGDNKTQGDKISRKGRTTENEPSIERLLLIRDARRTVTVTYEIEVVDYSEMK